MSESGFERITGFSDEEEQNTPIDTLKDDFFKPENLQESSQEEKKRSSETFFLNFDRVKSEKPTKRIKSGKLKIKLVVAEIARTPGQQAIRKLISPLVSGLNMHTSPIGFFHSALIVGGWYLEWNSSSLCIPRKSYSTNALLAIDVGESDLLESDLDAVIDQLSLTICKWNTEKNYERTNCNCQHFVDDVLKTLSVELKFERTMKDFVGKLRTQGECKIEWTVPKEIRETCFIRDRVVKFSSHSELDTIVSKVLRYEPEFRAKYYEDWSLLKAFDRAFWLKHYKARKNVTFQCKHGDEENVCGCPFEDPEKTRSICAEWW
jgi:hypothetical protein